MLRKLVYRTAVIEGSKSEVNSAELHYKHFQANMLNVRQLVLLIKKTLFFFLFVQVIAAPAEALDHITSW